MTDHARLLIVGPIEVVVPGEVLRRTGTSLVGHFYTISDVLAVGREMRIDVVLFTQAPTTETEWVEIVQQLYRLRPRTGVVLIPDDPTMVGPMEAAIVTRRERGQLRNVTAAAADEESLVLAISRVLADVGRPRAPEAAPADISLLRPAGRVRSVLGATVKGGDTKGGGDARGRVVTVLGPKGGVGKTTVSVGLACIAARSQPHQVVLVDLDLEGADVAVHLDMMDAPDIIDLIPHLHDQNSGLPLFTPTPLAVVPGPARPYAAEAVTPQAAAQLLETLSARYRWVFVDVGSRLSDEVGYKAMERADRLVMVLTPDAASLRMARLLFDHAENLGWQPNRCLTVLNQMYTVTALQPERVGSYLSLSVRHTIPLDRAAVDNAILHGRPLVCAQPNHPVSRAIAEVAAALGIDVPSETVADGGLLRKVTSMWRRERSPWRA